MVEVTTTRGDIMHIHHIALGEGDWVGETAGDGFKKQHLQEEKLQDAAFPLVGETEGSVLTL